MKTNSTRGFCFALACLACALGAARAEAAQYFLFTSFRGNGEDGLHLALSTNGYQWQALSGDRSMLRPQVGADKLMRDPCLAEGPDGVFRLVWTSSWTTQKGRMIGYAESRDLVTWSERRAIPLMENEPGARNLWAPEVFYDQAKARWLVFWSSTVPGKFPETDAPGNDGNHRVYCATTADFKTFSASRLFYDPGFNAIDATMLPAGGKFYLFFKDERKQPLKKNLRYAVADQPDGPFGKPGEPFTGAWVEGPSAIKIGDEYLVYFDHYTQPHYYGAVRSKDLVHWEDCSKEMTFPAGHRHGTVLRIPEAIASQLR